MSEHLDLQAALMVRKRGLKRDAKEGSYVLRATSGNRETLTLGYTTVLAPGEARDLALTKVRELQESGGSVLEGIRKHRQMKSYQKALHDRATTAPYPPGSLGHLLDYYEETKKGEGKDWKTIKSTLDASIRKFDNGKALLVLPAKEVTATQLNEFFAFRISQGVTGKVNMLHTFVRAAYNLVGKRTKLNPLHQARTQDVIALFELNGHNPAAEIERVKEFDKARERFLSNEELKRLLELWPKLPVVSLALVYGTLFSAVRPLQLVQLPWEDYDMENLAMTAKVQIIKQRRFPHVNPIIPAMELLLERLRPLTGGVRYPIAKIARRPPKGRVEYANEPVAHNRFSASLQYHLFEPEDLWEFPPFQAKDIRRTVKTHMTRAGFDPDTIKRLQIHSISVVDVVHYNMYDYWPEKKTVMRQWQEYLEELAEKPLRPQKQQ